MQLLTKKNVLIPSKIKAKLGNWHILISWVFNAHKDDQVHFEYKNYKLPILMHIKTCSCTLVITIFLSSPQKNS